MSARLVAIALVAACGSSSRPPVVEAPPRAIVVVIDRWASASTNPNAAGDLPPIATAKIVGDALLAQLGDRDLFSIIVMQRAGGYTQGVSCQTLELRMTPATDATKAAARRAIGGQKAWEDDVSRPPNSQIRCVLRGIERGVRELARARDHGRIIVISDDERLEDDRAVLEATAAAAHAKGVTISTIALPGGGELDRVAAAGRGRAYFAKDDAEVVTMLGRELAILP
ncbi:MAG TPA: hypothetical protein VL463_00545 [Kofleriaceae bacterium]|nr:hypothetical protein [Kofleriaceae bacterium]